MRPIEVLADYVRRRRDQLGMTQAELADRADLSLQTIKFLETCHLENPPKLPNLRKLARALRVNPDVLISLSSGDATEDAPLSFPDGTVLSPLLQKVARILADYPEEELARQLVYFEEDAKRFALSKRTPREKEPTPDA